VSNPQPKRSGNPARRAAAGSSAQPPPPRSTFAEHSKSILIRLTRLPRYVLPGIVLALMLVGLSAPLPYAVVALGLVAALVGWLAVLSWPILTPQARLLRTFVMLLLVGAVIARVAGAL
jgi:hypothetical protein